MTALITKDKIADLIPQGQPFVFIDELIYHDEKQAIARTRIDESNALFDQERGFSPFGLIEIMAQTAAAHTGYAAFLGGTKIGQGLITTLKKVKFHDFDVQGGTFEATIRVKRRLGAYVILTGEVRQSDRLVCSAEFRIFETGDPA